MGRGSTAEVELIIGLYVNEEGQLVTSDGSLRSGDVVPPVTTQALAKWSSYPTNR